MTFVPNFNRNLQTWLLGISSLATVGAFTFLWNLNRNVGIIQEQNMYGKQRYDQLQSTVNKMQLDLQLNTYEIVRLKALIEKK